MANRDTAWPRSVCYCSAVARGIRPRKRTPAIVPSLGSAPAHASRRGPLPRVLTSCWSRTAGSPESATACTGVRPGWNRARI